MPRKIQPLIPNEPYFISARCINREWFRVPLSDVWTIMSDYLFFLHHAYEIRIFAFVLMSNHFHMLAKGPDLGKAMNYFMRETSRIISRQSGRINQVYGGPYHKTLVASPDAFGNAYRYLYRNPVDAGMVGKVEDYQYSTLHGLLGQKHLSIPLVEDEFLVNDTARCLQWLNESYKADERKAMKTALSHGVYELGRKQSGFLRSFENEFMR